MTMNVKCYKDSLHFDLFDLRVIKCGIYNKDKFFVAKIRNFYPYVTIDSGLVLIEIIPLYTVGREQGIFTKKPLQNYNNIHSLLVPDNIAHIIKERWVDVKKGENFLISFLKDKLYTKNFASTKDACTSFTILPKDTIIVSSNKSKTYYKVPPYTLPAEKIIIPSILIDLVKCTKVIQLDRLQWRTDHFLDATSVKQLTNPE